MFADILWSVLCGHQPISQNPHLHRKDCLCIQRKTPCRDAASYLLNLWQCLSRHAARSWESVHADYVSIKSRKMKRIKMIMYICNVHVDNVLQWRKHLNIIVAQRQIVRLTISPKTGYPFIIGHQDPFCLKVLMSAICTHYKL